MDGENAEEEVNNRTAENVQEEVNNRTAENVQEEVNNRTAENVQEEVNNEMANENVNEDGHIIAGDNAENARNVENVAEVPREALPPTYIIKERLSVKLFIMSLVLISIFFTVLRVCAKPSETKDLDLVLNGLLLVFALENSLKILAFGWQFFRDIWNIIDAISVYGAVLLVVMALLIDSHWLDTHPSWGKWLVMIRIFRFVKLFSFTQESKELSSAIVGMIPIGMRCVGVMGVIFYAYASIGMECFGGVLVRDNLDVIDSSYGQGEFWSLNFDNLNNATVTLYQFMIGNNWSIMEGTVAATSDWAMIYFISFAISCSLVGMHMLFAFIIEAFEIVKLRQKVDFGVLGQSWGQNFKQNLQNTKYDVENNRRIYNIFKCACEKPGDSGGNNDGENANANENELPAHQSNPIQQMQVLRPDVDETQQIDEDNNDISPSISESNDISDAALTQDDIESDSDSDTNNAETGISESDDIGGSDMIHQVNDIVIDDDDESEFQYDDDDYEAQQEQENENDDIHMSESNGSSDVTLIEVIPQINDDVESDNDDTNVDGISSEINENDDCDVE
eukprot:TRINITY_DN1284_c0_g2_i2.p1 TRINITY_DN1284_c0_g2~~TRINITY_DN1284_c0_g2_i2.p1  ORF type:complete len:595 (+),score=190.99 TRINITY_DN1284_c0_g2_i2:93-1787(+)